MPIGWLTEVERHRLQRFPPSVPEPDLVDAFVLTDADRRLVLSRYGAANRLALARHGIADQMTAINRAAVKLARSAYHLVAEGFGCLGFQVTRAEDIQHALDDLYGSKAVSTLQLSATFRRGDLIQKILEMPLLG